MSNLCLSCQGETTNPKYCSSLCASRGRKSNDKLEQWLRGELDPVDKAGKLIPAVREYLLEEAGNKCTRCGWGRPNPVTGKPILCVHHKDGDSSNRSRENLVVLCYNCQTLTPSFGALNRGVTKTPKSVYSRKKWEGVAQ